MKKKLSLLLVIAFTVGLFTACSGDQPATTGATSAKGESTAATTKSEGETTGSSGVIETTILTYRAGEDAGARFFEPQIERFNKLYEGKYKITIEESPSNTHTDKIKSLAQQNMLPTIFQVSDSLWVNDYLIANGKLENLAPWIDSQPEMKKLFIKESLDFLTRDDGAIYALPLTVLKPTGLYYNSALVDFKTPVTEMSWDSLAKNLGDTKIAFQTAEGGWTTSLLLAGIIGGIEGGPELLKSGVTEKITDFNNPIFVEAFTTLQNLYKTNGWENAVGATYPDAATSFYSNKTSLLPDGTWIIDKVNDPTDWANGFDGAKVVGDYYPNNVAIADAMVYDWMMPAGLPADQKELGLAFFEFINTPEEIEAFILAEGGSSPNLTYTEEFKTELAKNALLSDFTSGINDKTTFVGYFHGAISDSLFRGDYTNFLPKLLKGEWTPEQFCSELTKAAQAL